MHVVVVMYPIHVRVKFSTTRRLKVTNCGTGFPYPHAEGQGAVLVLEKVGWLSVSQYSQSS